VPVYCVYVLVIVDFLLLSFKLILGCVFSLHHVNQGGVQKTTPEVTLYKPDTAKESLRRHRAGRHSQVLPDHAGQPWDLLLVLLPPHERFCVVDQELRTILQISHPHPGSSWPFSLLHPLPHSQSLLNEKTASNKKIS
jgi:hypothetical protein